MILANIPISEFLMFHIANFYFTSVAHYCIFILTPVIRLTIWETQAFDLEVRMRLWNIRTANDTRKHIKIAAKRQREETS